MYDLIDHALALARTPRQTTLARIEGLLHDLAADPAHREAVAAIRPGKFVRDPGDPHYCARAAYTASLRRFLYNPPVLEAIFGDDTLRALFFRTFGYRGQTRFTVYPAAWLRDLPLLDLGVDCYLADGIVLGTNQVGVDQRTLIVDRIAIGARTVFDQQCMVGYGVRVGDDCTLGARVAIGMKSTLGDGGTVRPLAAVGHHCRIGRGVHIGHAAMVGGFSVIEDGVVIDDYARIPEFSRVSASCVQPRRAVRDRPHLQPA